MAYFTMGQYKIALVMHLIVGTIMLSTDDTLSLQDYKFNIDKYKTNTLSEANASKRFENWISLTYLIFAILVVLGLLFQNFRDGLYEFVLQPIGVACKCVCFKKPKLKRRMTKLI